MDGKDLDLIALSFALSRYRAQGDLLDQDGQALSVTDLKVALLSGTAYVDDADININIGTLDTESNVTIIEQTVDCDEHSHQENTPSEAELVAELAAEQEQPPADPVPEQQEDKTQGFGGRLFQYFKGGKNEQQ